MYITHSTYSQLLPSPFLPPSLSALHLLPVPFPHSHLFVLFYDPEFHQGCLCDCGFAPIDQRVDGSLLARHTTEVSDHPSAQSIRSQQFSSSPLHAWLCPGTILCRPRAGDYSYCEIVFVIVVSRLKIIFHSLSSYFLVLMFFLLPLLWYFLSLGGGGISVLLRAEHSVVNL